jgi:hypothetical protein
MAEPADDPLERLARYRKAAEEAKALAASASTAQLRDAYLGVARTWTDLAGQLERELSAKRRD